MNLNQTKTDKSILKVDWCSHEAAKYACEHWYYTHSLPPSKLVKVGAWERGEFVGVMVFSPGANNNLGKPYGLKMTECCELVRVAFKKHETPLTRILSIAVRNFLKKQSPGIRLILSFADSTVHHGGIYQGMGWMYIGDTHSSDEYIYLGKRWQGRAFRHKYKGMEHHPDVTIVKGTVKHRYAYPLDEEMRKQIQPLAKPFPKPRIESVVGDTLTCQRENERFESASDALCVVSVNGNTSTVHVEESGSIPTTTLQQQNTDEVTHA